MRLVDIARDRLGYQEYLDLRDTIDRNINATYAKLQRKDEVGTEKRKKKKEKEKEKEKPIFDRRAGSGELGKGNIGASGAIGSGATNPTANDPPEVPPAARGLGPDEHNRLVVSEQLRKLVGTRRDWVDKVGSVYEQTQIEFPGRIWGFPPESIYKGVEEEVRKVLSGDGIGGGSGSGGEETRVQANGGIGNGVNPGNVNGTQAAGVSVGCIGVGNVNGTISVSVGGSMSNGKEKEKAILQGDEMEIG